MPNLNVLLITTQWPTTGDESRVPYLVRRVEYLRQAGITMDVFHFRGGWPRLDRYIRAWVRLRRVLQGKHYDIVDVQFGQSGIITLFQPTPPIIATFHGTELHGGMNPQSLFSRVLNTLSTITLKRAERIVLVSETLKAYLPTGITPDHIIPTGVDLTLFTPQPQAEARSQLDLDLHTPYALFTGGVNNPIKRLNLARQAAEQAGVTLLIADNVPPEQMPTYINAADLLLLTSRNEGSPTIVKEALACNVPVVSVDVGDVRQRIEHLAGCALCEDDAPATIAASIRQVLATATPFEGRSSIINLSEEQLSARIIEIYKQMAASK